MRNLHTPRVLWVDAICISQSDVSEKEHQVQLMPKIFSHAQRTLIWLGDANEKCQQNVSKFAILSIRIGLSIFRRHVDISQSLEVPVLGHGQEDRRTVEPFSADFYLELMGMLRMPWFQRAWVVQEVAVSSEVTISWGSARYDWEGVIRALKFMSQVDFPLAFIVTLENISAIEIHRWRC
jgi:Heterokaryon incompatibility protein (HET)